MELDSLKQLVKEEINKVLEDQSTTTGISWNNGTDVTTNAIATAIGTGSANTALIISVQGSSNLRFLLVSAQHRETNKYKHP